MKRALGVLLTGCVSIAGYGLACGCKQAPATPPQSAAPSSPAVAPVRYDPSAAPSPKEIIRVLLKNQGIALAGDPSCAGAGTDPKDIDLGDYLSGFMAEQDKPNGGNWIEAAATAAKSADGAPLWQSHVVIRHAQGDDVWGWGVSYLMRGSDHSVVPGSVRCTGSG